MTVKTEKYVQIGTTTENQLSAGRGWSPILANVIDGERVVQQVIDWTGGNGSKPAAGQYIGVNGFVEDIADATDIKGEQGADGAPASLQDIDDRIAVQLDTGGTIKAAIDVVQSDIDTHEADTANPHAVTKTQVGLSNVADVDTTTTANITDSTDKRFVTDAQQAKFVAATTSADGYLTSTDWNTFNSKQSALGFTPENSDNKSDDTTLANDSSIKYTTEHAVKGYVAATSATIQSGTICTTNPASPVAMSGLYSRSYTITANTTFDLSGWVADAYTLTIRNDSVNTAYTVTLNGVTGESFILEGCVGAAQGSLGSPSASISLRAGETIEVRNVGTITYRVKSSFLSWNFMGDFKIRSTYTSALRDISFTHASGAAFTTSCVITIPNVAAVDFSKIPTALSYAASTGVVTLTNTDATTFTASLGAISDSIFRIQDNGDLTKQIAFEASAITTGTTRTVTMPNAAVNLGKVPTAISYASSTSVLTLTTTDGLTLTTTLTKPAPTKQTTSFAFASSNIVCRWDAGLTGAKTVTLPFSPSDGDTVELWDNEEASVYGSSGITTLTVIASGGTYIIANPLTSYDVLSGVGGVAGMALRFVYRSATQVWSVQYFYMGTFNSLDWVLEEGTNSARRMKYSLSALTAIRTVTCPDANVNLGKIPTALSYSASTDTLTHTNTDGTTLTATIKTKRSLDYALSDQTTAITTGTPLTCRAPYAFTITGVKASLKTAQASGSLFTLDIKKNGTSIFSTLLTFDNTEKTTATAATAAVLSSTTLADDDELTFIVTQVGDGTAIGLVAYIIGYPT